VNQRVKFRISQLGLYERIAVKNAHGVDADHTLDSGLAFFRFVWGLLGPYEGKT
jgi:hypothetical protein